MIYSISGTLKARTRDAAVIESRGIGFYVVVSRKTLRDLPRLGASLTLFCSLKIVREQLHLFGFLSEKERELFETFDAVDGVGPRGALRILESAAPEKILSAIASGRAELLARVSGIGAKKAAKIVLEMRGKIAEPNRKNLSAMEGDSDVERALHELGFKIKDIRQAIERVPDNVKGTQKRLKAALKILKG